MAVTAERHEVEYAPTQTSTLTSLLRRASAEHYFKAGENHFPKGRPGATNRLNPLSPSGMSVEAAHCKYDTPPQDYWWSPARGQELTDEDQINVARRSYDAMCVQHPDRLITLCDPQGRILARSASKFTAVGILADRRN